MRTAPEKLERHGFRIAAQLDPLSGKLLVEVVRSDGCISVIEVLLALKNLNAYAFIRLTAGTFGISAQSTLDNAQRDPLPYLVSAALLIEPR